MATTTAVMPQTKRSADRIFFPLMTVAVLVTVWVGFSRTYYAVGMIHAPLPNLLIHVHAVIMTAWLALLIAQTGLVSAGRTDLHRKLGLFGFGWACLLVLVAPVAATDSLRRGVAVPGMSAQTFYAIPIFAIVAFLLLAGEGYMLRSKPGAHKRLMMLATIDLIAAAIGRFPGVFRTSHWYGDGLLFSYVLVMAVYDLATTRRVQKATIWGGVVVMAADMLAVPIGMTPVWQAFARWMMKVPV